MLTIRQLTRQTVVSSKTLRYWESVGLLPRPDRNYNNYRLYKPEAVQRVTFIQKAKSLGFTLVEIARLFDTAQREGTACSDVVKWTEVKIQALEQQIRLLSKLRGKLMAYQKEWKKKRSCPPLTTSEVCCLIESLPLIPVKKGGDPHALFRQSSSRTVTRLPD